MPAIHAIQQNHRERMNKEQARSRPASILTDIHFWVPAMVLLGGLLLLKFLH
jgi:hypothetical protein